MAVITLVSLTVLFCAMIYAYWLQHAMAIGRIKTQSSFTEFRKARKDYKEQPPYRQLVKKYQRRMKWLLMIFVFLIIDIPILGNINSEWQVWVIRLAFCFVVIIWLVILNLIYQERRLVHSWSLKLDGLNKLAVCQFGSL